MLEFIAKWGNSSFGMIGTVVLFIIGLAALIKGGDWFVDGATGIAKKFHIPELLIGATVVSIGTTLPEVMVSATDAVSFARNPVGEAGIAYGNAIGSVICNTALIAALTVAISPAPVTRKTLVLPVVSFFIAAGFYCGVAYYAREFTRPVGFILLAMFVIYMVVSTVTALRNPDSAEVEEVGEKSLSVGVSILLLAVGAALIAVGANFLVDNGKLIASAVGVPDAVIGLTIVALGTSLPELVTAITSLAKGHGALSLGNIIGANIFNLVLVSGTAITIAPFKLPAAKLIKGTPSSLVVDIPVMMFVMALLTLPALIRGKLSRVQGFILLAVYVGFCAFQFMY